MALLLMSLTTVVQAKNSSIKVSIPVGCSAENIDEEFTYQLAYGPSEYQHVENDSLVLTNGKKGAFAISYDVPGTYSYEVSQKAGKTSAIEYDKTVYSVNVVITSASDGSLQSEVIVFKKGSKDKSAQCDFVNKKTSDSDTPGRTPTNPGGSSSIGGGSSGGTSVSQDGKGGGLSRQAGGYQTGDIPIVGLCVLFGIALVVFVVAIILRRRRESGDEQ